ncbi:hypothetical protein PHET_04654 [Paragonimus heterotremus]|uniref:Uncharacterized protein n=1 Tax=Paragonimus heterotremus TaxID=100268 RepID=A0A8J4TGC4_9TREM|nr:hypothetical protein PHET_04654 [Paragonimus heterotremus]
MFHPVYWVSHFDNLIVWHSFATVSLFSFLQFSPPEPMKIRERYVPSPPPFERCDSEYRRNKEMKMNALRNVLLRQSFADDSVHDFDQEQREEFPGHRADWIKQRTQLLSMQHRLAKEAVASAGNITANRLSHGRRISGAKQ